MKDNFSSQSDQYLQFRPRYPLEMFDFISGICPAHDIAWDCGTGNGQVAKDLCKYFDLVVGTDISEKQIKNALQDDKIIYKIAAAEATTFEDNTFDLIAIAQAIHWFNFEKFYSEAYRTIKDKGIIAVIGYGLLSAGEATDTVIRKLYEEILGPYWDKERKYIDELYQTIPFPFEELQAPRFRNELEWTLEELIGYLGTWSAVKHYMNAKGYSPIELVLKDLQKSWGRQALQKISFPLLLRVGQVKKTS